MSLIEHARSLVKEVVSSGDHDVVDDETAVIDVVHEPVGESELERTRREWAAPPKHQ